MKNHTLLSILGFVLISNSVLAQSSSDLLKHYKSYYIQMQKTADAQGIINALNHLVILEPNVQRR